METKCTSGDRSLILRVLQQELGERPVYHFAPEFRYSVGGYSLLRDGRITAESDGAGLFPRLAELGLCDYPRVPKLPEPEKIAFPMETQNGRSLLNLLCILTARQILLNRALALRPGFLVTGELVEDLIAHPPVTVAETLQALYGREEEHRGVRMDLDFLVLTGFAGGRPAEAHIHRQMGNGWLPRPYPRTGSSPSPETSATKSICSGSGSTPSACGDRNMRRPGGSCWPGFPAGRPAGPCPGREARSVDKTKQVVVIPAAQVQANTGRKKRTLRVAAYCRVSTDEERQLGSFENQIEYFTRLISENKTYKLVNIYSDEGISGTSTRRRSGFQAMIRDCEAGNIDLIITKSISRFARNTQDSLNYTRKLKDMGIGVYFEKEGINTLESSGELLLTLFSCFAQEESRSISENTAWGIRSKFQQGIPHLNVEILLGYDKDSQGNLVINEEQAKIVKRVYRSYLEGFSLRGIAKALNADGIHGVKGEANWCATTVGRLLENEKYKGALLMQKTYTANYLTRQNLRNTGQLNQYYIAENHPAIIPPEIWEAVQEEIARRRDFRERHGLRGLSCGGGSSPFYARTFCGGCGKKLNRVWQKGVKQPYWYCRTCGTRLEEPDLRRRFCGFFNTLVRRRQSFLPRWQTMEEGGTPLEKVRARQIRDITAAGTIPWEVPELTRTILGEIWLLEGNILRVTLLSGETAVLPPYKPGEDDGAEPCDPGLAITWAGE